MNDGVTSTLANLFSTADHSSPLVSAFESATKSVAADVADDDVGEGIVEVGEEPPPPPPPPKNAIMLPIIPTAFQAHC